MLIGVSSAIQQKKKAEQQAALATIPPTPTFAELKAQVERNQRVEKLAAGLLEKAVRNALSMKWSRQVEGQVNSLETIKRAMYGRANLDLLHHVLYQS